MNYRKRPRLREYETKGRISALHIYIYSVSKANEMVEVKSGFLY